MRGWYYAVSMERGRYSVCCVYKNKLFLAHRACLVWARRRRAAARLFLIPYTSAASMMRCTLSQIYIYTSIYMHTYVVKCATHKCDFQLENIKSFASIYSCENPMHTQHSAVGSFMEHFVYSHADGGAAEADWHQRSAPLCCCFIRLICARDQRIYVQRGHYALVHMWWGYKKAPTTQR